MSLKRVTLALVVVLAACRTTAVPEHKDAAPAIASERPVAGDAGVASIDAGAPAEVSPFVAIAHTSELRLERISGSPVLGIDPSSNFVWELGASGSPRVIEPLALRVIASERSPFIAIGRVAGRWPTLHVELGFGTGRGEPTIHNFVVDDAKQTIKTYSGPFGHVATSSPWVDGTELAFGAWDTSTMAGSQVPRRGSFVVLDGPKHAVPKVPKELASVVPVIAAYDTGRIFFLGGVQKEEPEYSYDEKNVWSLLGAAVTPMPLKGAATHLVRGRSETETLVAGADSDDPEHRSPAFLVRFDGTAWRDVPLPFREPIRAISAGDDGTVWIVSGGPRVTNAFAGGAVWRARFPALQLERVALPAGLAPYAVSATKADDAWIAASDGAAPLGTTLLHTQGAPVAKVLELPTEPVDVARLTIGKREPAPWTPSCLFPFLSFGKEGERTVDALVAFGKAQPDWSWTQKLVLARLPSGEKVWGTELYASFPKPEPEEVKSARTLQTHARAQLGDAKLLCTALPIEREVEVVPPPPKKVIPPPPPSDGAPRKKKD